MFGEWFERANKQIIEYTAQHSIEWKDEDKFSFLWDGQVVIMHVDRERQRYSLLSHLEPEVVEEIGEWLGRFLQTDIEVLEEDDGSLSP